jgi:hypothetical protein
MIYAQFFRAHWDHKTGKKDESRLVKACGDRSVIILYGPWNEKRLHEEVGKTCKKRKFLGYQLFKGETFTRSVPISPICRLAENIISEPVK